MSDENFEAMNDDAVDEIVSPATHEEGDLFDEGEMGGFQAPDLSQVVTLRTSNGDARYVPVDGPTSVSDLIARSGLYIGGAVQYWVDGVQVQASELIAAGKTVTIIGSVKGGDR